MNALMKRALKAELTDLFDFAQIASQRCAEEGGNPDRFEDWVVVSHHLMRLMDDLAEA